jgi:glucose-1-phosphate cytidylyltransferase
VKVVILAGGLGTRLAEETEVRPKPMVPIGGRPILWHIMKHFAHHGHREFLIALGYKGEDVKRYFLDYPSLSSDLTVHLGSGRVEVAAQRGENWTVHLVDTGVETLTGGRVKRLQALLGREPFLLTYGDGLTDLDLGLLLGFHRAQGRLVTLTAVRPPARFGELVFDGDRVVEFREKPSVGEGWINGGFMVCEPGLFGYLEGDGSSLEADALEGLARDGQLAAYRHQGFWQCMDTLRDVRLLERLWRGGSPPWRVWPA